MTKDRRLHALRRQIDRLQLRLARLERLSYRLSSIRLAVFAFGVLAAAAVFFFGDVRLFWLPLLLAILPFGLLVRYHRRVERSLVAHKEWARIKEQQTARMTLDWERLPPSDTRPQNALELDLDLVGSFSLHRLIDTSVSQGGSLRLRTWLAARSSDPAESLERQSVVRELAPLPLFRDRMILSGRLSAGDQSGSADGRWSEEGLLDWMQQHALPDSVHRWLLLLAGLAALNAVLFILHLAGLAPPLWRISFLLYVGLFLIRSRELGRPFGEAAGLRDSLEPLVGIFRQLEEYSYRNTPGLKSLCAPFLEESERPSNHLRRVNRTVTAAGIRRNPFFWLLLNAVAPWDYYVAVQLDRRREELAKRLPLWMNVWYELEALGSLANLAYLNPHFSFPELMTTVGEEQVPLLEARELGHPLIPDDEKVCNDFAIETLGEVNLFTGSNMSGKSTFLRTVGLNLSLAFAGGPADARLLRTVPFRMRTCIRIKDSVTDGISYFYAEVKCLKALLVELEGGGDAPLIYFIDEIFRGTNNRERLIGSRAYMKALAGKFGAGLVSTHDLELIQLADELPPIRNHHFRDEVAEGRLTFDFKLHRGPSPTTNALRIMRAEGLPI
jgi:ABC-type multidrug transport system fused ATPase/permease subunit